MNTFKVVVLGQGGVGKSAFSIQFVQGQFIAEYDPTIEDSYRKQVTFENRQVMLEILDTAGTEQFRCMRDLYMKSGDGFFLVYSIIAESTFLALPEIRDKILRVKDLHEEDVPMVLIGNKVDLEQNRQVPVKEAKAKAAKWGVGFLETSAKTKKNVDGAFMELIARMERKTPTDQKPGRRCNLF
eukprot:TRINITY_DN192_c0_g1_i4.p1 TRINITY_DN192_c0_g1~~TRINITY_DN192_c0_g1_i4.p1  ORF type:complete len:184 (+),score=23.56 TRINITY_DN192_c0_g1_i4:69-620(+)